MVGEAPAASRGRAPRRRGSARGGASYGSPTTTRPASSDAAAHAAKTAAGPLAASRTAATSGPPSVASESSMPRTAFALVSSLRRLGQRGQQRRVRRPDTAPAATVATTAKPYVAAGGPPAAVTAAAHAQHRGADDADAGQDPLATNPVGHRREERRERAPRAAMRAAVTAPTAATPPSRNATTPSATMNALSPAHIAANEIWARRSGPLCATWPSAPAQPRSRARERALTDATIAGCPAASERTGAESASEPARRTHRHRPARDGPSALRAAVTPASVRAAA